MRIADCHWREIEAYLTRDDRCVLPFGSTEQHAGLSLCTDAILAEKVALEAAEPLGVPVYPAMPFGLAPYFAAFAGSVSLRVETLLAVARDLIESLAHAGFRRILLVNGHGGNAPVGALAQQIMAEHPHISIRFHNWYNAPATWATALAQPGMTLGSTKWWMSCVSSPALARASAMARGTKQRKPSSRTHRSSQSVARARS